MGGNHEIGDQIELSPEKFKELSDPAVDLVSKEVVKRPSKEAKGGVRKKAIKDRSLIPPASA